jgi:hypothetical protein
MDSDKIFAETHCSEKPVENMKETLPVVPSDAQFVMALTSKATSSLDSIEMELQAYMDCVVEDVYEVSSPLDYESLTFGAKSDVSGVYGGYDHETGPSVGQSQSWLSGGYEDRGACSGQQTYQPNFTSHYGMNVAQEALEFVVGEIDLELYNNGMQDEDEDSEYGIFCDAIPEDDATVRDDTNFSFGPMAASSASDANDHGDNGWSVLLPERFSQGRAILLGISEPGIAVERPSKPVRTVLQAEAVVAKGLREHWLPQKF